MSELYDLVIYSLDNFQSDKNIILKDSKSGWLKFKEKIAKHLGKSLLVAYEGGSSRHPYFAFSGLAVNKSREYNCWKEKCISSINVITTRNPAHFEIFSGNFTIAEHAISRLYHRAKIRVINETDVDIFCIVDEMKFLSIWTGYWMALLFSLQGNDELIEQITPVLPSPSGLFLAEISKGEFPFLEIRTFVGDSELTDEQLLIKKKMIQASKEIQGSPLAFFPDVQVMGLDFGYPGFRVLSARISDIFRVLADEAFHRVHDRILQRELTFILFDHLTNFVKNLPEGMSENYVGENVRRFHLQIKGHVLRAGGKN